MKTLKRLTVIPLFIILIISIPILFIVWVITGKNSPIEIADKYTDWLTKIDQ